jgi:hypothetical protein
MYVQPEGLRKVGRPRAKWGDEVGKDAGFKELVGNSHELRRVEETSEGGQDSLSRSADDDDDDTTSILVALLLIVNFIL